MTTLFYLNAFNEYHINVEALLQLLESGQLAVRAVPPSADGGLSDVGGVA
jgi:hypothetical protein